MRLAGCRNWPHFQEKKNQIFKRARNDFQIGLNTRKYSIFGGISKLNKKPIFWATNGLDVLLELDLESEDYNFYLELLKEFFPELWNFSKYQPSKVIPSLATFFLE